MTLRDGQIASLAADQFGIVGRQQLTDIGLSDDAIRRRVIAGSVVQIFPSAFRIAGAPTSWEASVLAAQLSLGGRSLVSHRSSAALYDLEAHPKRSVELTLWGERSRSLPGVVQHRAISLTPNQLTTIGPFRTTRPERLLLDLAAVESAHLVEVALDSILYKHLTSLKSILKFLAWIRRPGIRGVRKLERILDARDPDRAAAESVFETKFFKLLTESSLPKPTFQFEVFDEAGFVARLDVAYPVDKIGVEAQSLRWHSGRERVKRDAERQNRLVGCGWRVLYETYEELNQRPHDILNRLERLLRA